MVTLTDVCDNCVEAVIQEGDELGIDLDWEEAANFARELGADIADHFCDYREAGKPCGCACRQHDK